MLGSAYLCDIPIVVCLPGLGKSIFGGLTTCKPSGQCLVDDSPNGYTNSWWRNTRLEVAKVNKVRILQKSQENGQNRTNTNTGTDRVHKSQKFLAKVQEVPADYVSAGHVLISADRDRIC
ncbi:hypothetical protein Tco_0935967 [Tanacetum coccineum]